MKQEQEKRLVNAAPLYIQGGADTPLTGITHSERGAASSIHLHYISCTAIYFFF